MQRNKLDSCKVAQNVCLNTKSGSESHLVGHG